MRRELIARRREISDSERERAGLRVAARIAACDEFLRAERIVLSASLASELPMQALTAVARGSGKGLLWPRVTASGEIEVARAEESELERDAAGVLAPPRSHPAIAPGPGDALIVPGVAFTRSGERLGRGGGHYDRLLVRSVGAVSIGVAFDIQVVAEIPTEPHDRRVDIVATPNEIWRTAR